MPSTLIQRVKAKGAIRPRRTTTIGSAVSAVTARQAMDTIVLKARAMAEEGGSPLAAAWGKNLVQIALQKNCSIDAAHFLDQASDLGLSSNTPEP